MDLSAGAAWGPFETLGVGSSHFGLWVFGDVGYGLVSTTNLQLRTTPDDEEDPQQVSSLDMGSLNLGGIMVRAGAALTF